MQIEELWTAGLSACLAGEFDNVRKLYRTDESFGEMCRDFVEIYSLTKEDRETDVPVHECLTGLKDEIRAHFANAMVGRRPGGRQTGSGPTEKP